MKRSTGKSNGKPRIQVIRERILELGEELDGLQRELTELQGHGGANGRGTVRSPSVRAILDVVHEAGEVGMTSKEVQEAIDAELDQPPSYAVTMSYLSRMVRRGQIRVEGPFGNRMYFPPKPNGTGR